MYARYPLLPGIHKDDSPLQAQGWYTDGDQVRFVAGLPEMIYGQEGIASSALTGVCRGLMTYEDIARNPLAAFGTHLRLEVMDIDGNVTDITPATAYSQQSISFTTTLNSTTVTITGWTHGLVQDELFKLENSTVAAVGGVTINGTYTAASVVSTTSITFVAAQTATSSAGPTAATVDITIYLAPGQVDGLGGIGYGVGGYGSGGYGSSSSAVTLYPRTWALAQWGQNLLANPRGGGIYEWAPNTTNTELVTNGDFSNSVGWSQGTGWSIGAGVATATAGTGSDLSTSVTASAAAWHLLTFTLTRSAGTIQPKHGTTAIGSSLNAAGLYRLPFFANGGSDTVVFSKDATFAGSLDNVSLKVLTTGQLVTGAPTQVGSMFVTAERIVVACGSNLDGTYDSLQIDWSDAEDNQDWVSTANNLAGGETLPSGGRVIRGLPGNGENLVWTNDALWSMRYNGNPDSVYDFVQRGSGCGLAGPNAAAEIGGIWYWITPAGAFYAYGGAEPVLLLSTLARDFKDNLALVQQDKIYATRLVGKNYAEIWWFYPDSRDGTECSRYIIYDTKGQTWSCGKFNRTAFADATNFPFPLAADVNGKIWYHEKGFNNDGAARSFSLTTAMIAQDGQQLMIDGVRPDGDDIQGGYSYQFFSKNRDARGIFSRTYPALNMTTATGQRNCQVQGEQVGYIVSGTDLPLFWRMGATMFDVTVSKRKR